MIKMFENIFRDKSFLKMFELPECKWSLFNQKKVILLFEILDLLGLAVRKIKTKIYSPVIEKKINYPRNVKKITHQENRFFSALHNLVSPKSSNVKLITQKYEKQLENIGKRNLILPQNGNIYKGNEKTIINIFVFENNITPFRKCLPLQNYGSGIIKSVNMDKCIDVDKIFMENFRRR